MSEAHWELFPHGADIGVRGIGDSKAEAFEQVALALTAVIADPQSVTGRERIDVTCEAPDDELLLVEWLNALVFEMATRRMLFARFEVRINSHQLVGKAWGEPIDESKHDLGVEVKGATCTNLSARCDENGRWLAKCVVDV